MLTGYFALTGGIIASAGGRLIKTLGAAGLAAFFASDADAGVRAMLDVQRAGDAWLVVIVGRGMLGHSLCTRFEWAADKGGAISIGTPILQRARLG